MALFDCVQSYQFHPADGYLGNIAFQNPVTAGNLLIGYAMIGGDQTAGQGIAMYDNRGNSWTTLTRYYYQWIFHSYMVVAAVKSLAGMTDLTFTHPASNTQRLIVAEYDMGGIGAALDVQTEKQHAWGTALATDPTEERGVADELLVCAVSQYAAGVFTPTVPPAWTVRAKIDDKMELMDVKMSSVGTEGAAGTIPASCDWWMYLATFKRAGGGDVVPGVLRKRRRRR